MSKKSRVSCGESPQGRFANGRGGTGTLLLTSKNLRVKGSFLLRGDLSTLFSIDDIVSSWSVGDHGDRVTDPLFHKLHISAAVFRQILIFPDPPDLTLPSWQLLQYRLRLLKKTGRRELVRDFPVDLISHAHRISSRYPSTSSTVKATSVVPCIRQPYRDATQSNHPILLGRPVVAPNSPPSPPRRLSSSASSPKISLTKAPAPTALEYALQTVITCRIS